MLNFPLVILSLDWKKAHYSEKSQMSPRKGIKQNEQEYYSQSQIVSSTGVEIREI